MKKSGALLLVSVIFQLSVIGQNDSLGLLANVSAMNNVQLKWLPSSYDVWIQGSMTGYTIERYEVKQIQGKWSMVKKDMLTAKPVMAWTDKQIEDVAQKNPDYSNAKVLIAGRLLRDNSGLTNNLDASLEVQNQKNYLHVMCLLSALLKNKSAEAMGLFYEDKTVQPGKIYLYRVVSNTTKKIGAETVVNMNAPAVLSDVMGFNYKTMNEKLELYWLQPKQSGYFAYNVYRSESRNGEFQKINTTPYLGEMGLTLDSKRMKYIDSFPEMSKTYYYKVQGINGFEALSPFSQILSVKAISHLKTAPSFRKASSKDNATIQLEWTIDSLERDHVAFFSIWSASSPEGKLSKVNTKEISGKTYAYQDLRINKPTYNYYKVCAHGEAGDSLCSLFKNAFLVDSIPPKQPFILSGICDTNGVVTIQWKKGKDSDLYGYRVFKTVQKHKEPNRITRSITTDTTYRDTIDIKSGYRKIYYCITAIDQVYNASEMSPYIEVKIPDKIAPAGAIFKNYVASYSGIKLDWIPSPSEDIKYQYLMRKSEFEFQWRPVLKIKGDSSFLRHSYKDTLTQTDIWYEYKLVSEDSAGLQSKNDKVLRIQQPEKDPFPIVTNVRAVMSRQNKMIKLSWDFNKEATGFKIMRGQNGKRVETYEFVNGRKREFYDTWLTPNTEYSYAIIAELPDGRTSVMSVVIKINY